MSKTKKALIITLAIIFAVVTIVIACFYFYADAIRFDYCDSSITVVGSSSEEDIWLRDNGYTITLPYFGNSASLEGYGAVKSYPFGIGKNNESVYAAVNNPIYEYGYQLTAKYQNRVKINYTVENNGSTLIVHLNGTALPESITDEPISVDKTFTFNIENAGLDNLPFLI